MIYVGIDVAKDKHDCFALDSNGEILIEKLTITNNLDGFETLYISLMNFSNSLDNIKVGLEATGHYSNNILNFLTEKGFNIYLINPLQTNLYVKGQSLRKTKTDKLDAHIIATMLISDNLKPYIPVSYHISELKSLTRHRFRLVKAIEIREIARKSIGTPSESVAFELKQTINIIQFLQKQIDDIDKRIKEILKEIDTPILSILGISFKLAGSILGEIGDISKFDSPSKLLSFAGLAPSMYQSGKFFSTHSVMVKRGSKYLRFSLMNASRMVCMNDAVFNNFKNKKMSEGKHYMVTMGHVAKKLVRVIYYLLKTNNKYEADKVA